MTDEARIVEHATRRLLDRAARDLDGRTLERLRQARAGAWRRAEKSGPAPASRRARRWLPVAGASAAGLALAVAAALWLAAPQAVPVLAAEDLELLAGREGPDFYTDLEFYQWVAAHESS